ncbi:MAG: FAD-dependent oxidoreductase [Myxococcaceae bacterium]
MPAHHVDVVVIGGGHNGLVAAALLAKQGRRVVLLEKRDVVGGAAITETPWGPDFKVTALSYVVSLLPPSIVQGLELEKYGYQVFPQGPYFAPHADGRFLQVPSDEQRRHAQVAKFSARDADELPRWEAWLKRLAGRLGPLLAVAPPKVGSKAPGDLLDLFGLAWKLRGLSVHDVGEATRLLTSSIADLLDERFESPQLKGLLAVSGIIGTWAGPRAPGTAFVMAHHQIGDTGHGQVAAWGFPKGGMGGVTQALRRAAEAAGVQVRTGAAAARILTRDGRVTGVATESGDECQARAVVATCHPAFTFLKLVERSALPADFVRRIETWRSRSGVVKVNLALDRLPDFKGKPGFDPEVHGGTIVLADSLDDLEGAFQDAVGGRAARLPFADVCIPSVFDRSLAPEGKHVMSLFTQWVPHPWADAPDAKELDAYVQRLLARMEAVAPGFTSSILHQQVIGPFEMQRDYGLVGGNIFHGELSLAQLFHLRPAAGYADFTTPITGLYHASSATHGGGGVTGIPALQAVRRLAGS